MTRPNFFCDVEALNCLLGMQFEGEYKDIDLTMDMIEIPYFFVYTSDTEKHTLKALQRGDMYMHNDEGGIQAGNLVMNKATEEGKGEACAALQDNLGALFEACRKLSCYIQDKGLEQVYEGFDPEEKGIRLIANGDQLDYKVVEGKDRPDLMCNSLFGGIVMGRPYMEDFFERSEREMMSLKEMIEAAEAGDVDCMDELMLLYLNGDEETEPDPQKAVYWMQKMAEAGNSNGMFNLGLHYAKGHGVERDFEKAAYWMAKAEEAGDSDAAVPLKMYRSMAENLPKAEAGDAEAQAVVAEGLMSLGGSLDQAGPDKDFAESVKWAMKSANQRNGHGLAVLALAYEHGRGVPADLEKAIKCYQWGVSLGNAFCQHNMGCKYIAGEQVPLDKEKGFELIRQSAEQGHGPAMRDMGKCYQFGEGCSENMKIAVEWYEKALEIIDDPELERKTALFKMMLQSDMTFGEDYEGAGFGMGKETIDDSEMLPEYEFDLTKTKSGPRKERSNKVRVGDKVSFKINPETERIDAITSIGDIGDISTDSWLSTLVESDLPYEAEVIKVISYAQLENKRKNPTIEIRLRVNATRGEAKEKLGWRVIPDGIYGNTEYFYY